jgi:hypothetical protein
MDDGQGKTKEVQAVSEVPQPPSVVQEVPKALEAGKPTEEDLQRSGETLAAANNDAMAIEQAKAKAKGKAKRPAPKPKYFMEADDRHRVEVDILLDEKGNVQSVSRSGLGIDFESLEALTHVKEWFEFSIPGYEDVSRYRQMSAMYRAEANAMVVDKVQFRNFLLVWHLKDWSMQGRDGERIVLEIEEKGRLSSDSIKRVYAIHPTIVDVVLTAFEKDALLMRT